MDKIKKQIYLATSASFVSGFGNGMFSFAIDLYVLRKSSSPLWFAGTQIISPLIAFFLSRKIGNLIDKYPHKTILKWAYLCEFVVTMCYFFLLQLKIVMSKKFLITLVVLVFINILNLVEQTAYQSSVINLVPGEKIQRLNSLQRLASSCSQIFSPALGAAIYSLLGIYNMISIRLVTVVVSLFLILGIDFQASVESEPDIESDTNESHNFKILEILRGNRVLLYAITMSIGVNIFLAISNIVLPFMMVHVLKFTNGQYGLQQTMVGVGSILAGIVLSLTKNIKNPIRMSMFAMINISISLMIFGSTGILKTPHLINLLIFFVVSIIMGASLVSMEIPMSTYMQSSIPKNIQGRIFSFVFGASQIAMPIGTIIGTVLVYKPFMLLVISGILMMMFVLINYWRNGKVE
ncbi:MFS transporter [Companilactobacillus huachuanensis]|uniref:MFS transporter n=1 Tax=Companilactobacillus huachuanensis TaxID=2559914 RepID=A0ABW1RLD9_9LACO|nr:MFS transporter [Companilactobacillus huachuanensis]